MTQFNAAFREWFGDSKVVDGNGQPLVVYHGTDAKFNEFSYTNDIGYHFGSKKTAMARLRQAEMKNGFLMPVYLRIENPLELPDLGLWDTEEVANALFDAKVLTFEQYRKHLHYLDQEDVQKLLAAKGYDGIVYPNKTEKGGDSYIVFDSRQIKSATGNRGTWSRTDPDIRRNPIPSIVYHGTSQEGAESIRRTGVRMEESGSGYFGTGFYVTPNEDLARSNYAGEDGVVLKFQLSPRAYILDLMSNAADFEVWKLSGLANNVWRPNFHQLAVAKGIQGVRDPSMGGLVIYDPKVLKLINPGRRNPSEEEMIAAMATARAAGAVGAKAITPLHVQTIAKRGQTILDFGSGPKAAHTMRLRAVGLDVTAHDFPGSMIPGVHDPTALARSYDIVMASNVLNVQSSYLMLKETLDQLIAATAPGGRIVANMPVTPRKLLDIRPEWIEEYMKAQGFGVKRISGGRIAPLWEFRAP